jgi:hypothetical protein
MSNTEFELNVNNVLLALQLALGLWQFMKLTPVGALIRGVVGWLLQPFRLSPAYSRLQNLKGRVFKRAHCFVLQAEIPSERRKIPSERRDIEAGSPDTLHLRYLGREFLLERRGSDGNMLFIDGKMCYYITPRIWEELQALGSIFKLDAADPTAPFGNCFYPAVFLKGQREFWKEVSTGGVMTLEEVLDGLILYNQHASVRLNDDWLLPVNLSVSEEKLLKIINLLGLFLQTRKVHWLIPTLLSFMSAVMEFSTTLRVWLYSNINVLFCNIMHLVCHPLPRSWRRQIYCLGKWVENLKPSNDIELKIKRGGNFCATIAGGAKVDKEGATLVPWLKADKAHRLNVNDEVYLKQFRMCSIEVVCTYRERVNICHILAPTITKVDVDCKTMEEFTHIITFVSWMAENCCGSLKSCAPNNGCGLLKSCRPDNKVSVRGFREPLLSYVKNGCPPLYVLEVKNVVFT